MLLRQIHFRKRPPHGTYYSKIYELIKDTDDLIKFEEQVEVLMHDTFTDLIGEAFTHLNKVMKKRSQKKDHTVERNDQRTIQFSFGPVTYNRTLLKDRDQDKYFYPLDKWLGFRKYQWHSPLVEVKVAELASQGSYREATRILSESTPVDMSHTTVGTIIKRVEKAQEEADKELVDELDIAATLPEGKKVDFLYSEADGVFVRGTKKRKHHEVYHGITYEGWSKNGERVSLVNPRVILTTLGVSEFWKEMQASSTYKYSLEDTQIITNSDGGSGYSAERFQEAFSQSNYPVLNQFNEFHNTGFVQHRYNI